MTGDRSPLREIELLVQARAKELHVEPRADDGPDQIRALIYEAVDEWQRDFKQGTRPVPIADVERLADRAYRNLVGYGPLEPLLEDPAVWEIMVNSPTEVFVKRHQGPSGFHTEVFHDDAHVQRVLTRILDDNAASHRTLDPAEGLQDAQLLDGSRLHIAHGDLTRGGHTLVNIRRFSGVPFRRLRELTERDMITREVERFLQACVQARLSMVFAGAPGSGKTTLLSCCAAELDPELRVVVAEEVFECDIPLPNVAQLQTRPGRPDRPAVDLRRIVAGFLRMAPDIAIVGEVRDREALPLLLTLSSGVKGFTTIHAGSARQALTRLRFVAQLADSANELPMSALNSLVSEAVDVVVHCSRVDGVPRVTEVIAVEDLHTGTEGTSFTATDLFTTEPGGGLSWTGDLPVRAESAFARAGIDVRHLLGRAVPARRAAETLARSAPVDP